MLHVEYLKGARDREQLVKQAMGRYYTGELVGRRLAKEVASTYHSTGGLSGSSIRLLDPFGGDGRLVEWLIEAWYQSGFPDTCWDVAIWDIDKSGLKKARSRLKCLAEKYDLKYHVKTRALDTFSKAHSMRADFDIIITNPPWELLRPDRRELKSLNATSQAQYIAQLRAYDRWLGMHYPLSQPRRKFAGWGTNLSRVGLEASLSLVRPGGVMGAILPASILADNQTAELRKHLLTQHSLVSTTYYPAEAKLYENADVASIALTLRARAEAARSIIMDNYDARKERFDRSTLILNYEALQRVGHVLPVSFGVRTVEIAQNLSQRFPSWLDLESTPQGLWAGREIDETGISRWLCPPCHDAPLFVKGRMIDRYSKPHMLLQSVKKKGWSMPISALAHRIAWRDVSRPSQRRRIIATLIEPGCVAGNSIGVAYFKDMAEIPLLALLGIMNSTCFEFQLRAHLSTGHVSLSSLRKVAVPSLAQLREASTLAKLVKVALHAHDSDAVDVDAYVARRIYNLTEQEYRSILESFHGLPEQEQQLYLQSYRKGPLPARMKPPRGNVTHKDHALAN